MNISIGLTPICRWWGDILRFDAMFGNYAQLCAKSAPGEMRAIRPFVDMMSKRAQDDVDDSYDVMERISSATTCPAMCPASAATMSARRIMRSRRSTP